MTPYLAIYLYGAVGMVALCAGYRIGTGEKSDGAWALAVLCAAVLWPVVLLWAITHDIGGKQA